MQQLTLRGRADMPDVMRAVAEHIAQDRPDSKFTYYKHALYPAPVFKTEGGEGGVFAVHRAVDGKALFVLSAFMARQGDDLYVTLVASGGNDMKNAYASGPWQEELTTLAAEALMGLGFVKEETDALSGDAGEG